MNEGVFIILMKFKDAIPKKKLLKMTDWIISDI